jgi:hypothetical protein
MQGGGGGIGATAMRTLSITIAGAAGTGVLTNPVCGAGPVSVRVSPSGDMSGEVKLYDQNCTALQGGTISGRVADGRIQFNIGGAGTRGNGTLTRR